MKINPNIGVGELSFGESRENLRSIVGGTFEPHFSELGEIRMEEYDYFPERDLKLIYDDSQRLFAVELFEQSVILLSWDFLENSYEDTLGFMKSIDPELKEEGSGFTSIQFGIGVTKPSSKKSVPKNIIVFKKGYYDQKSLSQKEKNSAIDYYLNLAKGIGD